tara:strand:- start:17 stop:403 length:387 start_codon:yes stop_codon:yes gene_type:complete
MLHKNLSFSLVENNNSFDNSVTYESLKEKVDKQSNYLSQNDFNDVNMDDYIALEIDYNENYTKKQIDLIADYYEIVKRKKKKAELIEEVVIFEKDPENFDITQRRKTLWFYMEEINNDSFLSKFLILE